MATRTALLGGFATTLLAFACTTTHSADVVGGSDLLNASSAAQLETWLGAGQIELTNIFDKSEGESAVDFHAAADGKGATFSIIEVIGYDFFKFATPVLIGGYNPQSWTSAETGYRLTPELIDRTAFIFNMSDSEIYRQRLDSSAGEYQTYNNPQRGPTFGAGSDFIVDSTLSYGYSRLYSYGTDADQDRDIARYPQYTGASLKYGRIEVFSIANVASIAPVPEPEAYALMLVGLGGLTVAVKRRKLSSGSRR